MALCSVWKSCSTLVHDDGMILINDYGQTQVTRDDEFEHQRFSLATFVGVNFPLLKEFFSDKDKYQWIEPSGNNSRGIHSRLLGQNSVHETVVRFYENSAKPPTPRCKNRCKKPGPASKWAGLNWSASARRKINSQRKTNACGVEWARVRACNLC